MALEPESGLALAVAETAEPKTATQTQNYGDVNLTQEEANKLARFLSTEIFQSESDKAEWKKKLVDWRKIMDPPKEAKDTPWPGAANFQTPLGRIAVDAVKAGVKETFDRKQKQLFVCEVVSPTDAGVDEGQVAATQEAFNALCEKMARDPDRLDIPRKLDEFLDEMGVSGMGLLKLTSERDEFTLRVAVGRTAEGAVQTVLKPVVLRGGPQIHVVPTETFAAPAGGWNSLDKLPWLGNYVWLTPPEIERRAQKPWGYVGVKDVLAGLETYGSDPVAAQRAQALGHGTGQLGARVYDIYLYWSLPDPEAPDGRSLHALHVTLCPVVEKILRILVTDGSHPFEKEVYSPRSGALEGRGLIEHAEQLIRGINTSINQTFDAQTLANCPSIQFPEGSTAADKLAGGFAPGMQIPNDSGEPSAISVLKFPDPGSVSFQIIEIFLTMFSQLTRVGPGQLGDVSQGRRTPATLGLAMQQVGAELRDELIDRMRLTFGRVMSKALMLQYEDAPEVIDQILDPDGAALVKRVLQRSHDDRRALSELVRIRLAASSAVRSKELERQNALAIFQTSLGWSQQVFALMQAIFSPQFAALPPQAKQVVLQLLGSSEKQLRRLLELSEIPDANALVPEVAEQLAQPVMQMQPPPPEMMMPQGTGGAPPGGAMNMNMGGGQQNGGFPTVQ